MNRRGFLRSLVGAAVAVPAARTWPFRTFFFPPVPAPDVYRYELFWLNKAGEIIGKPDPLVWFPNPAQKAAWDELVTKAYSEEMAKMVERQGAMIRYFQVHKRMPLWNNLQRSPIRWSSRNNPLRFA